jgi:hypothetical protein
MLQQSGIQLAVTPQNKYQKRPEFATIITTMLNGRVLAVTQLLPPPPPPGLTVFPSAEMATFLSIPAQPCRRCKLRPPR